MIQGLRGFTEDLRRRLGGETPSRERLERIGRELCGLCAEVQDWSEYRIADTGESLAHALAVDAADGISLYLVSDGVGVGTPPHEHQTWAVVVGTRGTEHNLIYRKSGGGAGRVALVAERRVGPGDILVMEPHEIHAIDDVRGDHPTFHVHLYGRALVSLPSFDSRRFVPEAGGPPTL